MVTDCSNGRWAAEVVSGMGLDSGLELVSHWQRKMVMEDGEVGDWRADSSGWQMKFTSGIQIKVRGR